MPSVRTVLALGMAMASAATAQTNPHNPNKPKSPDNPSTASTTSNKMGPAAFLWPHDRIWDGRMDNSPPCGSVASPGNRTKFSITNGQVRLVGQDDYYESTISISYLEDPKTNKDFKLIKGPQGMNSLDPGHTCIGIPNPDASVKVGTHATLQIVYIADWDTPGTNQTFYACADIVYAEEDDNDAFHCFNGTEPGEDDRKALHPGGSGGSSGSAASGTPPNVANASQGASGGSKLSGGALAAAIICPLVGVSMLAAGLFLYRRRQQHKRSLRLARMEENARREQWPMDKVTSSPQKSV